MAEQGESNTNQHHCSARADGVKRKKKRTFWEEFPFGSAGVGGRDENHLRNREEMSKVNR
jgi:hypothetical protein